MTPRNPHYQRPCYHCHKNEARPHSNFCAECSGGSRPLFFPSSRTKPTPLRTGALYAVAAVTASWLIWKTVELVLKS